MSLKAYIALATFLLLGAVGRAEPPATAGEAQDRFPPLIVPEGFRSTLFAGDPQVEYPSVIALGPEPGTLFVAHDYMTGLGTEIIRRDEVRLLHDKDGDGAADESIVYAGGFNSIQGLAYHAGTVFVMHAPLLTSLRDTDGDGIADERRDLLSGLGLPPEDNPPRLHCANGVVVGYDGWLYLALGDHGVDVQRPEGDRLVLHGGGILRCRPDGRDLHIFSTGLRNIYDIALDDALNVFVRDNENDGGDYMIRVCHSFQGADHGYPYLYYEHPDEALRPLADLGRGSSAGIVCYLENAFPSEYRGNLFCCEWGRAVVRYDRRAAGSSFAPTKEVDFAVGTATDPYGFKPTDLVVDRDGSLLISDWADGQRPKRGRGRIYRISYAAVQKSPTKPTRLETVAEMIQQLDAPSYYARLQAGDELVRHWGPEASDALWQAMRGAKIGTLGRLHGICVLFIMRERDGIDDLLQIVRTDPDPVVRAQAIRAAADLSDPIVVQRRLDAGRGDAALAEKLAALAENQSPVVLREIVIALGRLKWADAPRWLRGRIVEPDEALAHSAMQTLRRCDNWGEVLALVDLSDSDPLRSIALRSIADHSEATIVDGLIERLGQETEPSHRKEYAAALARVYKRPPDWQYWGYRPAPRPANTVEWERTKTIAEMLNGLLGDRDRNVRLATLKQMLREQVPTSLPPLFEWLSGERRKESVAEILTAVRAHPPRDTIALWEDVAEKRAHAIDNRLAAIDWLLKSDEPREPGWLLKLATSLEDGPVMAALLADFRWPQASPEFVLGKLSSPLPIVRKTALTALARGNVRDIADRILPLLDDPDAGVRRAAAAAAGKLGAADSRQKLLHLAAGTDLELRSVCLDSLRQLGEGGAVALAVSSLQQDACQRAALDYLADWGSAEQADAVAKLATQTRSHEILAAAVAALTRWRSQESIAAVQGASGLVLRWNVQGPIDVDTAKQSVPKLLEGDLPAERWMMAHRDDADGRIDLPAAEGPSSARIWLAASDVFVAEATKAQFLASGSGALNVWLNGRLIHEADKPAKYQPDAVRFEGQLREGTNRLLIQLTASDDQPRFQLRIRRIGSSAEHERLTQHVLSSTGNAERGREVFLNADKSLCMKCHRIGEQGGRIGPDLSGIGSRFSRVHIIESILEPSRTIAPSFETIVVALSDGRILTGVKAAEDERTLTLGDEQGRLHEIAKTDIDERQTQTKSTMPEGLEKRLNDRELLDLVTFLLSQRKPASP